MKRISQLVFLAAWIGILSAPPLLADATSETAIPGVAPLPKSSVMTQDELSDFFQHQKKGTPIQLTLAKDKVANGLFSNYDEYYETVWLVPQGEKGMFNTKGYRLSGIHSAVLWDRKIDAALPQTFQDMSNQEYYLLKDSGEK